MKFMHNKYAGHAENKRYLMIAFSGGTVFFTSFKSVNTEDNEQTFTIIQLSRSTVE